MIEGHHVTARAERQHVVRPAVVADLGVRADLGGAVGGRVGEDPELDAEPDRRLSRHPGQLTAADHPDDGLPVLFSGPGRLRNAHPP